MTLSFEDAWGLLSKWKSESVPIAGVLRLEGAGLRFGGVISELVPHALVVSHPVMATHTDAELLIGLQSVKSFDYQDLREAPAEMREKFKGKLTSVLVIDLPTCRCLLYEVEAS